MVTKILGWFSAIAAIVMPLLYAVILKGQRDAAIKEADQANEHVEAVNLGAEALNQGIKREIDEVIKPINSDRNHFS